MRLIGQGGWVDLTEAQVNIFKMRDRILLVFDEHYSSNGNLVFAAARQMFQQMGASFRYSVFTRGRYHGPVFGDDYQVDVSGPHLYAFNRSMRPRDRVRRLFSQWRLLERVDRWISNVEAAEEGLMLRLRDADSIHAVILFVTDPAYGLKWIRIAHVFAKSHVPHLIVVTPASVVVPQIVDDIRWLGGRILRDSFPLYQGPDNQDQVPTVPAQRLGSRQGEDCTEDSSLADLIGTFMSFDAPDSFRFGSHDVYPYPLDARVPIVNWLDWIASDLGYEPRIKSVVLFVRPNWMSCGSGTTFSSLARWFRANDSLLIDVAISPYGIPFDDASRGAEVAEEQREIGAALFFSLRRSASIPYLAKVLVRGRRWWPSTVTNQVLLWNAAVSQPALMTSALAAANLSHIYLNHYFTYLFAEPFIKDQKFFLDTHDIQSINFVHHASHNAIFRREDKFEVMLADEMKVLERAERLCFVSEEERDIAARHLPKEKLDVVIALPEVLPRPRRPIGRPPRLLLVASDNPPNRRNVAWFLQHVWQAVLHHFGTTVPRGRRPVFPRLDIYGRIADAFPDVQLPHVQFHGMVEDLADAYHQCDAVALPVIMGGGVAIKTIEALLYECPVIATRHALRGLPDEIVRTVGFHQGAEAFARQIATVLKSDNAHARYTDRSVRAAQMLRDSRFYDRLGAAMRHVRLDAGTASVSTLAAPG